MINVNAWGDTNQINLKLIKEEIPKHPKKNDFQDGDYQWADEPDEILFSLEPPEPSNASIPENVEIPPQNFESSIQKNGEFKEEEQGDFELSEKQMRRILVQKHAEEMARMRRSLSNVSKVARQEKTDSTCFNISDKYLKKQINLNRNILLYEKKWLSDPEFKFFFNSVYYQNILATDLQWREDYQHLLFVRLMSYHNIGISPFLHVFPIIILNFS